MFRVPRLTISLSRIGAQAHLSALKPSVRPVLATQNIRNYHLSAVTCKALEDLQFSDDDDDVLPVMSEAKVVPKARNATTST